MRPDPTRQPFQRLDLDDLIAAGHKALHEQDYHRAHELLREATRRAPLRQDIREWLAQAVEGKLQARPSDPGTAAPTQRIRERLTQTRTGEPRAMARSSFPREAALSLLPEKPAAPAHPAAAPPPHPHPRPNPVKFRRRHQRGPLSALFMGAVVGIVLVVGMGLLIWRYMDIVDDGSGSSINQSQTANILENAERYRQQGKYAWAIEQLETLPEGSLRRTQLAKTYMEQGNQAFMQQPPQLQSALGAYQSAVELAPENPAYGIALGEAYYLFSRNQAIDREAAQRYLEQARQTFESVLDRDPANMEALKQLKKVAIALRDDILLAQIYRRIIDLAPDSQEAEDARRDLRSLGFKF